MAVSKPNGHAANPLIKPADGTILDFVFMAFIFKTTSAVDAPDCLMIFSRSSRG